MKHRDSGRDGGEPHHGHRQHVATRPLTVRRYAAIVLCRRQLREGLLVPLETISWYRIYRLGLPNGSIRAKAS
jgi:hypothetical protein